MTAQAGGWVGVGALTKKERPRLVHMSYSRFFSVLFENPFCVVLTPLLKIVGCRHYVEAKRGDSLCTVIRQAVH